MPEHIKVNKSKKETKPYSGICSPRCWTAKSEPKKCKCKCQSAHHGDAFRSEEQRKGGSCPRCGSKNASAVPQEYAPEGMMAYECNNCHFEWFKPK